MIHDAQYSKKIVFENVSYDADMAQACMAAYAAELSARLNLTFDLNQSGIGDVAQLTPPLGTFIIARIDDTPLGCVGIKGKGCSVAEVKRLWIDISARGMGLAKMLMFHAELAARDLGITILRLDTNSKLFEAVKLYESLGWTRIDRFNDDPYPDVFFEKLL